MIAVEVLSSIVVSFTDQDKQAIRILLEGLFTHFFPPEQEYYLDDVVWFLKLANAQKDWQQDHQFEEKNNFAVNNVTCTRAEDSEQAS